MPKSTSQPPEYHGNENELICERVSQPLRLPKVPLALAPSWLLPQSTSQPHELQNIFNLTRCPVPTQPIILRGLKKCSSMCDTTSALRTLVLLASPELVNEQIV
jgi:hypothetical protein